MSKKIENTFDDIDTISTTEQIVQSEGYCCKCGSRGNLLIANKNTRNLKWYSQEEYDLLKRFIRDLENGQDSMCEDRLNEVNNMILKFKQDLVQLHKELKTVIDKRLDVRKNHNCPYNTSQFLNSAVDIIYSDFDYIFSVFSLSSPDIKVLSDIRTTIVDSKSLTSDGLIQPMPYRPDVDKVSGLDNLYDCDWVQVGIIHCPNPNCKGMLLSNPYKHEFKCSDCNKLFMDVHNFVEVK